MQEELERCVSLWRTQMERKEKEIEKIRRFGEIYGICFQIKDDILSVEGDINIFGKPIGNDEARGKCTYVTKYGLIYAGVQKNVGPAGVQIVIIREDLINDCSDLFDKKFKNPAISKKEA